jgi:hypothetical protein
MAASKPLSPLSPVALVATSILGYDDSWIHHSGSAQIVATNHHIKMKMTCNFRVLLTKHNAALPISVLLLKTSVSCISAIAKSQSAKAAKVRLWTMIYKLMFWQTCLDLHSRLILSEYYTRKRDNNIKWEIFLSSVKIKNYHKSKDNGRNTQNA